MMRATVCVRIREKINKAFDIISTDQIVCSLSETGRLGPELCVVGREGRERKEMSSYGSKLGKGEGKGDMRKGKKDVDN